MFIFSVIGTSNKTFIDPQVVIIETHNEFGMNKLAHKKGYRLVGANDLGFNFIFVKKGLADK